MTKNDDYSEPAQISKESSCESRNRAKSQVNSRVIRLKNKFLAVEVDQSPDNHEKVEVLKARIN